LHDFFDTKVVNFGIISKTFFDFSIFHLSLNLFHVYK
jgi:hypothetical protein